MKNKTGDRTKKGRKDRVMPLYLKIPFALILLAALAVIISTMKLSLTIREFDKDLWVLCHESSLCIGYVDGEAVRVMPDNQQALYLLSQSVKGKMLFSDPEEISRVIYTFDCHQQKWKLTISRIDQELARVQLEGERNYDIYLRLGERYETMVRIATQEGYQTQNKPFPVGTEEP